MFIEIANTYAYGTSWRALFNIRHKVEVDICSN
jgi:hypothetical protein